MSVPARAHAADKRPDARVASPGSAGRSAGPRVPLLIALLLAVLLTALVVAVLAVRLQAHHDEQSRDREALAAARRTVTDLLTVAEAGGQPRLERLLRGATGEFTQQLVGQSDSFTTAVRAAKVSSTGAATEAGIATIDGEHASVLVSAVATVRNMQTPGGQVRPYRFTLELVRHGSTWLVAGLEFTP
jgi:Mce-associated membrane protein